jgi:hypothetical protein
MIKKQQLSFMATVRVMKIDISAVSVIKNKLAKCANQPKRTEMSRQYYLYNQDKTKVFITVLI